MTKKFWAKSRGPDKNKVKKKAKKPKKVAGNKTDRYINLILEMAKDPMWSLTEDHLKELLGNPSRAQFFNYIKDHLEFDQLIWEFGDEYNPAWVHVSYSLGNNRMRILKAVKENGKTKYEIWTP